MTRGTRCVLVVVLATAVQAALAIDEIWESDNLAPNAGFERGKRNTATRWRPDCSEGSLAGRDHTAPYSGEASGYVRKASDGGSDRAALTTRFRVVPGSAYSMSAWAKATVDRGSAVLLLVQYSRRLERLGRYSVCTVGDGANQWLPIHAQGTLRTDCSWVELRFEIVGSEALGEAWIDAVYFGPDTMPPPPPRNLQATRGEDGVTLRWSAPEAEVPSRYHVYSAPYPGFNEAHGRFVGSTRETRFLTSPLRTSHYSIVSVDAAGNRSEPVYGGRFFATANSHEPALAVWCDGPGRRWDPGLPDRIPAGSHRVALDMARGEWENAQVLVGAPRYPLRNVEVDLGELQGPGPAGSRPELRLYLQDYVALLDHARYVADPLVPTRRVDVDRGYLRGWWIQVRVPYGCPVGAYTGNARVTAEGHKPVLIGLRVTVWPVDLPKENHYGASWGIWGQNIATHEGVAPKSPEYDHLLQRYAEFFREHRMTPRDVLFDLNAEGGRRWLACPGVSAYAIPWPWNRKPGEQELRWCVDQIRRLREGEWLHKAYAYFYDEPAPRDYPAVIDLARPLREVAPDIPILLTVHPDKALYGWVDIWCPRLDRYAETRDRCLQRQALGERVWWYVCCEPAAPWPNYTLLNEPADARVLSWLMVKYGVQGELYWSGTCFRGDVWKEGVGSPPGDGYLVYPGRPRGLPGPVPSIRAELIRDGKEDIELVWLVRHLGAGLGQASEAEAVVRSATEVVCRDFLQFTREDAEFRRARLLLLRAAARFSRPDKE